METMSLAFLMAGLGIGTLLGWLAASRKKPNNSDEMRIKLELESERSLGLQKEIDNLGSELKNERASVLELSSQNSTLKANHLNLQNKLAEQKGELADLQSKFAFEFKNLANDIFEEKSKKFTDQNKSNLSEILNPLKDRIEKFEEKVEKTGKESLQWNSALKTQLDHLKDLNQQITKEAESLTKALKGDSKAQGNWGELQLEMILEKVGLEKDVHYQKEQNFKTEEGANQRLDYLIKLPDEKYLVLDSKVSLTAYSNYFESTEEQERAAYLKQHLVSIHNHIKLLGDKNYQNLYDIKQPDFILMFVANEPALIMALKEDQQLYEKALDRNIVLVSTSTLLATLRTVSYIWKQDLQNKNALEIARQAGALYDKFVNFSEDLIKVGRGLETTDNAYKEAMKKLTNGSDNLVRKTERLKEIGAKASKQINKNLLDRSA